MLHAGLDLSRRRLDVCLVNDAGWALARWPTILPGLTVKNGAAGHDALVWIVVSVLVGGAIVFPSLGLLFRLELTGRFRADASASSVLGGKRRPFDPPRLTRVAVICLIAGLGLLTIADAAWAHAIGVVSLLGFMVAAFLAIVPRALADQAANPIE